MRKMLTPHLKDIRVCSLSFEEICCQVIPMEVLTYNELKLVCGALESRETTKELTEICAELEPRNLVEKTPTTYHKLIYKGLQRTYNSELTLTTNDSYIELKSLSFTDSRLIGCLTGTINLIQENNEEIIPFATRVTPDVQFKVTISSDEKNVWLQPNTLYNISIKFDDRVDMYPIDQRSSATRSFRLEFPCDKAHVQVLSYRVHTNK